MATIEEINDMLETLKNWTEGVPVEEQYLIKTVKLALSLLEENIENLLD